MNDSKEASTQNQIPSQNQITHDYLEWHLNAAQEALEEVQRADRQLYSVARFSKRISGALRMVNGLLDDAEILQRCGSLGSATGRDHDA